MKRLLSIILLAAALAAEPAAGQTIKSLGYNTTNGNIVAATNVTFTNSVGFATNARAATRTNLGGTTVGNSVFTATNAAAAATAVGLGTTNYPTFLGLELGGVDEMQINGTSIESIGFGGQFNFEDRQLSQNGAAVFAWSTNSFSVSLPATFATNITASGTLGVTGNVTLSGVNNTMPNATNAASGSSLMTRSLSDVRYLGEMWHAWRMSAYNTTNIPVGVFKTAPCVLYTNGQSAFYVEAFLDPSKYAGKTVRVLAYCRVDSTNGGNVQGGGKVIYLTNNAGGADPNFPLTIGGQTHGSLGVFTNQNTDVFPVATSTNQYLVFTSNVGTISNNATLIVASFGFNRASTNTTFTNGNLYMQAVEVVVENP
jgi:hypothetical protein